MVKQYWSESSTENRIEVSHYSGEMKFMAYGAELSTNHGTPTRPNYQKATGMGEPYVFSATIYGALDNFKPIQSPNVIDPTTTVWGYVTTSGTFATSHSKGERRSDYLPVTPGETITLGWDCDLGGQAAWMGWFFYDENKTKVGSRTVTTDKTRTLTVPNNAAYIVTSARLYDGGYLYLAHSTETVTSPYGGITIVTGGGNIAVDLGGHFLAEVYDYRDQVQVYADETVVYKEIAYTNQATTDGIDQICTLGVDAVSSDGTFNDGADVYYYQGYTDEYTLDGVDFPDPTPAQFETAPSAEVYRDIAFTSQGIGIRDDGFLDLSIPYLAKFGDKADMAGVSLSKAVWVSWTQCHYISELNWQKVEGGFEVPITDTTVVQCSTIPKRDYTQSNGTIKIQSNAETVQEMFAHYEQAGFAFLWTVNNSADYRRGDAELHVHNGTILELVSKDNTALDILPSLIEGRWLWREIEERGQLRVVIGTPRNNPGISRLDKWAGGELAPRQILKLKRYEAINGEHYIDIDTTEKLDRGRYIWMQSPIDMVWREYVVWNENEKHDQDLAVNSYRCVWSIQAEFSGFPCTAQPGTGGTPATCLQAMQGLTQYGTGWNLETDITKTASASFWRMSAWEGLAELIKNWGGEVDMTSGTGYENTFKVMKHIGSEEPCFWYEYGKSTIASITRKMADGANYQAIIPLGAAQETANGGVGRKIDITSVNDNDPRLKAPGVTQISPPTAFVENSEIKTPAELKAWGRSILNQITHPQPTYEVELAEALIKTSGYIPRLGDEGYIIDEEMGWRIQSRIQAIEADEIACTIKATVSNSEVGVTSLAKEIVSFDKNTAILPYAANLPLASGVQVNDTARTPRYLRFDNIVCIHGTVNNKAAVAAGVSLTISTLPESIRPKRTVSVVCQGTGGAIWLLYIYPSGTMQCARYRNGATNIEMPAGSELQFTVTYILD